MTIEDWEYLSRILLSLNNKVINFPNGSFENNVEWFNQEDLLRTMKRNNRGMDKSRLREFLDVLENLKFVNKREGKKQEKSQSKGEYKINEAGQKQLAGLRSLMGLTNF
jgi:hypothetical protein